MALASADGTQNLAGYEPDRSVCCNGARMLVSEPCSISTRNDSVIELRVKFTLGRSSHRAGLLVLAAVMGELVWPQR